MPRAPLLLLIAVLGGEACATVPTAGPTTAHATTATRPATVDLPTREERALAALTREDFAAARSDLLWIASRCDAGEIRTRALLLLAAGDLDPTNPAGSARAAAVAAAAYLLSDEASPDRLPVARALFRLAADRGALEPGAGADPAAALTQLAVSCASDLGDPSRSLPSVPSTSLAERIDTLESDLSSRSDSLAVVTDRVTALEAELQRIATILRDDAMPLAPAPGRP